WLRRMGEHSLPQRPYWCARPRFPGSFAAARHRPQAVLTELEPRRWGGRDRRAVAVRGEARRAEYPHSRAAVRPSHRLRCDDQCCRVLLMQTSVFDCFAAPRGRLQRPEEAPMPFRQPKPYATDASLAGVLDGAAQNEQFPPMPSGRSNEGCRHCLFRCWSLRPPVASNDPNPLLGVATKSKLRRGKQPIDDQHVTMGSVIDDFGLAVRTDDEQRRHLALNDARREFDIDLAAVVIGA